MTKIVPLTQGYLAIVDDEDFELVSQYKWYAVQSRKGGDYYARTSRGLYMHRLLRQGDLVDHKNGNTLDNRKSNLRDATKELNQANRLQRKDAKSPYKNVHLSRGYWVADVMIKGVRYRKWGLESAEAARDLVNQWKLEVWGFIPEGDR